MQQTHGEILTISVGTAIALEALIKVENTHPQTRLYMNVRTLLRNFLGSIEDVEQVSVKELTGAFLREMKQIRTIVTTSIPGKMELIYYMPSYATLPKKMPRAKFKEPRTNKQVNEFKTSEAIWDGVVKSSTIKEIKIVDSSISGDNTSAFIITHMPVDLLSESSFRDLKLVESHTGTIKGKLEWNTKLTNYEKYKNMPFCALTLQVFGDKSTMFHSLGNKFTSTLLEIAEKNNWKPTTTRMKIKYDLDNWKDKYSAQILLSMLKAKV